MLSPQQPQQQQKNPEDAKEKFEKNVEAVYELTSKINALASVNGSIQRASQSHLYSDKDVLLRTEGEKFFTSLKDDLSKRGRVAHDEAKNNAKRDEAEIKAIVDPAIAAMQKVYDEKMGQQFSSWMNGEKFDQAKWDAKLREAKEGIKTEIGKLKLPAVVLPPEPVPPASRPLIGPSAEKINRFQQEQKAYQEAKAKQDDVNKKNQELDDFAADRMKALDQFAAERLQVQMQRLAEVSLKSKHETDRSNYYAQRAESKQLTADWYPYGKNPPKQEGIKLGGRGFKLEDGMYQGTHAIYNVKNGQISTASQIFKNYEPIYREMIEKLMTGKGAEIITIDYDKPEDIDGRELDKIEAIIKIAKGPPAIPLQLSENTLRGLAAQSPTVWQAVKNFFGQSASPSDRVTKILNDVSNLQEGAHRAAYIAADNARVKSGEEMVSRLESLQDSKHAAAADVKDETTRANHFKESYRNTFREPSAPEHPELPRAELPEAKQVENLEQEVERLERQVTQLKEATTFMEQRALSVSYDFNAEPTKPVRLHVIKQQEQLKEMQEKTLPKVLAELQHKMEVLSEVVTKTKSSSDTAVQTKATAAEAKIATVKKDVQTVQDSLKDGADLNQKIKTALAQDPTKRQQADIKAEHKPHTP